MKKRSKNKTPAKAMLVAENALDRNSFDEALKCSQNIINKLEDRKSEIRKAQNDLEAFKEDFKEVNVLNKKLVEKMKGIEEEASSKNEKVEKLDQEVMTLFQETQKLREENEVEKKKSRELGYEAKYLKHNLDEEKNTRIFIAKELTSQVQEKEAKENQMTKMEILLTSKEGAIIDLRCKIECLEKEMFVKEKMIKHLDEGMKRQHGLQANLQHDLQANLQNVATQQQAWKVVQENEDLKRRAAHYKKCLMDLKEDFSVKEQEYRQHIKSLDKKLKVVVHNETYRYQNITSQEPSFSSGHVTGNRHTSHANQELDNTLKNLSDLENSRKSLLRDMQGKSMVRKEQIIQAKYDSSDLARKTRDNRKFNRIAIESDERKALLTRLDKLEVENQKLAAESKEVFFDMNVCKEQNTQLASQIRSYEDEVNWINEAEVRREENTKLAQRLRVYEDKLRKAQKEIACGEEWKGKCETMELDSKQIKMKLDAADNETKTMEHTIMSLQKDIEIYRKSSMMANSTSCCFDLKVGKQKLEQEVDQLQAHANTLEAKLKLSVSAEEELDSAQRKLEVTKKDLDRAVGELDDCKIDLKDLKQENVLLKKNQQKGDCKSSVEQPNVNVHVHLDPYQFGIAPKQNEYSSKDQQQRAKHSAKYQQPEKQQVENVVQPSSDESDEKIQDLLDEIEKLNSEKEVLEDRLESNNDSLTDAVCEKCENAEEDGDSKEELVMELTKLKKELAASSKENKKVASLKSKLESEINMLQSRIEEYETSESKMQDEVDELKQTLNEFEDESKENEKNYNSEMLELRQKLREQSTDDMECLRKKIQDLTTKKEKNETLIEKLREDKSDLQMTVQQLQRELDEFKKQLEDYEDNAGNTQQERSTTTQPSVQYQRDDTSSPSKQQIRPPVVKTTKTNAVSADDTVNTRSNVGPKKNSKPSWLMTSSSNNTEDEQNDVDDDFLDIPSASNKKLPQTKNKAQQQLAPSTTTKKKVEPKKSSKPLWLASTDKKADKNDKDDNDDNDDDDDFLGIRQQSKQQRSQTKKTGIDGELNGLMTHLNISNRRNVAKRNVSKTQQHQSDEDDEDDDDCKVTRNVEVKSKPKQTEPVDDTDQFLQSLKPKVKKQDDTLDFLSLNDLKTPPPVKKRQPISVQPPRPKTINNAEFLIPEL